MTEQKHTGPEPRRRWQSLKTIALRAEKRLSPRVETLSQLSLIRLLKVISNTSVVVVAIAYCSASDERFEQQNHALWGVVGLSSAGPGNEGRNSALASLNDRGASMLRLNLGHKTNLAYIELREAFLRNAGLRGARAEASDMCLADLVDADLYDADLVNANLSHVTAARANLDSANLAGARLDGAILRSASLRYADLTGASLRDADLSGADLRFAKVDAGLLEAKSLSGVKTDGMRLVGRKTNWTDSVIAVAARLARMTGASQRPVLDPVASDTAPKGSVEEAAYLLQLVTDAEMQPTSAPKGSGAVRAIAAWPAPDSQPAATDTIERQSAERFGRRSTFRRAFSTSVFGAIITTPSQLRYLTSRPDCGERPQRPMLAGVRSASRDADVLSTIRVLGTWAMATVSGAEQKPAVASAKSVSRRGSGNSHGLDVALAKSAGSKLRQ